MINKLRKKIFWVIQLSLSIIILGIVIVCAVSNYKNTLTASTMFMDRIEERGDVKGEKSKQFNNIQSGEDLFRVNIEGVYKIEIGNGNIVKESNNVTKEVRDYAYKIKNSGFEEGYIDNYIYKIRKVGDMGIEITLMENKETINRLKITVLVSIIIGFGGIFVVYIIAKKISKTIVKPVEETFEKQKQFVSDASHELKTPLAVIEANADVLQDKVGDNKWINYIQSEVQSMDKLVNDLLTLSKMEKINVRNYQKFDLSKEVQMSISVFESIMYEKEIKLETNIDENIYFIGEKEDIKHIISIILDNAIKHTEKSNKIIVNAQKDKNGIKIEIKNEGDPIPVGEEEKIFERFYRVDKARNRAEKRYGLGLAIAKGIVEKYNGIIKAVSNDGFTSFIVKLSSK